MQLSDQKFQFSAGFEAAVFASAEEVLAQRRRKKQAKPSKKNREFFIPNFVFELGAVAALLLASFFFYQHLETHTGALMADSLPDFPKSNDAPARYDAQWRAQNIAYQKEVENAHDSTPGEK